MDETAIRSSNPEDWPSSIIARHLHERRGHHTRRSWIGEALRTGGLSLVRAPKNCSCLSDATAVLTALLDANYVVVPEQENRERCICSIDWDDRCPEHGDIGSQKGGSDV